MLSRRSSRPGWNQDLAPGSHLVTSRRGYTHHGIYVGGGMVVHYAGLSRLLHSGPVEEVTMDLIFHGSAGTGHWPPRIDILTPEQVVLRARSRLGESQVSRAEEQLRALLQLVHQRPQSQQAGRTPGGNYVAGARGRCKLRRPTAGDAGSPAHNGGPQQCRRVDAALKVRDPMPLLPSRSYFSHSAEEGPRKAVTRSGACGVGIGWTQITSPNRGRRCRQIRRGLLQANRPRPVRCVERARGFRRPIE